MQNTPIRDAWDAGDQISALRIAARFFNRSERTKTFKLGIDAFNHPDTQIGKEPQQLITAALDLLAKRAMLNGEGETISSSLTGRPRAMVAFVSRDQGASANLACEA